MKWGVSMRRTTFSRVGKGRAQIKNVAHFLAENRLVYAIFVLFSIGILAGSLAVRDGGEGVLHELDGLMGSYIANRAERLFLPAFLSSFTANFLILLTLLFLGFCAIAPPIILLAAVARGFSLGISIAYLYMAAGADGIVFALQHQIPSSVISSFVLVLACTSSYRLARVYYSLFSHGISDTAIPEAAGACLTKYVIYTILTFLCALIDGTCCLLFGSLH